MDSIPARAGGLVDSSHRLALALYTWTQDTGNADKNVLGLCEEMMALSRVLDAIRKVHPTVPWPSVAEVEPHHRRFSIAVKASFDDIKSTLASVNQRLAELGEV